MKSKHIEAIRWVASIVFIPTQKTQQEREKMRLKMIHKKLESKLLELQVESYLKSGKKIETISGFKQTNPKRESYAAKHRIFHIFQSDKQTKSGQANDS